MFAYYEYDDPIPVEGTIHVGMVQEGEFSLNIGLDKNTDFNFSRLHYQLGLGADWTLSTIEGSVMIRPVLQAGVEEVFVAVEETEQVPVGVAIWPNPARDRLNVQWQGETVPIGWYVMDLSGRQLDAGRWPDGAAVMELGTGDLPRGMALLVIEGPAGRTTTRRIVLH